MKILLVLVLFALFYDGMPDAKAVPWIDPEMVFDEAKTVVVGRITSVEILSEPEITRTENHYSEKSGLAMYQVQVEEYLKNPIQNDTITVPGYFLREPHGMAYETYPYEVDQKVLLYLMDNSYDHAEAELIISSALSGIVEDTVCEEGEKFHRGECIEEAIPLCNIVDGYCVNPDGKNFDAGLNQMILFLSIVGVGSAVFLIIWRKRK